MILFHGLSGNSNQQKNLSRWDDVADAEGFLAVYPQGVENDFDCVDGAGCGDRSPTRPVTVVQFRGTNDSLVPYEGSGPFAGARANFATWGELNL